ncbi:MAG: hypothetical protein LBP59_06325 [Planctomycetaceae bacterium]|jgi:hypothetical protein|nr:hypothetical protein [Planctomycetaceae bacterium]
MDAYFFYRFILVILFCVVEFVFVSFSYSSQYSTANFTVNGVSLTIEQARKFCETAEVCRRDLSMLWLGVALPDWSLKYPIEVKVGENLGAGGSTTFVFRGGDVYGEMNIQGSEKRIIDSVLPHEVSHTIFATYFKAPVPRWLDEGAATCVEHYSERENYRKMIRHFLQEDVKKCLPFNRMVMLKEYPDDVMPFYAQGYSVAEYLITVGGHKLLIKFAETAMETGDWNLALRRHYGIENLGELQKNYWLEWVAIGSPVVLSQVPERLKLPQKNNNMIILANNKYPNYTQNNNNIANQNRNKQTQKRTAPPKPTILQNYAGQNNSNTAVTKIPASFSNTKNPIIPIPAEYKSSYEILSAGGESIANF